MSDPETWRWVWLAAAAMFAAGELATPGSFFLLPFAVGAVLAAVLAFVGVDVGITWLVFVLGSAAGFAALFPLRKRLDREQPQDGIGARRLLGQQAVVLEAVPAGDAGLVRVGREEWKAESVDGSAVPVGALVKVVEVRGTRVLVHPLALGPGEKT
jgi:membrane protein implicated in regulation of membrane protease activity